MDGFNSRLDLAGGREGRSYDMEERSEGTFLNTYGKTKIKGNYLSLGLKKGTACKDQSRKS